jgi:hypothetical protein
VATGRVPDVIHAYFKAVDDRDFHNLKSLIADDALIATTIGQMGDRRLVRTGERLRSEMESRPPVPWRHRVVSIHVHGAGALVEGELMRREVGEKNRFVAFFAIDEAGRVAGLRNFQPHSPELDLSAEDLKQWSRLAERVLNGDGVPDHHAPSADQVVAAMSHRGASTATGLSVTWMTRGAAPVAVVGRLGRVAEFAAVIRTDTPGAEPDVDVAWGPLTQEEKDLAHA